MKGGLKVSSPHFTAIFSRETKGYAVVVSKKVARLSVTRHRIKRRVVAVLRTLPSLPDGAILFPKSSVATLPYPDLQAALAVLLSKI